MSLAEVFTFTRSGIQGRHVPHLVLAKGCRGEPISTGTATRSWRRRRCCRSPRRRRRDRAGAVLPGLECVTAGPARRRRAALGARHRRDAGAGAADRYRRCATCPGPTDDDPSIWPRPCGRAPRARRDAAGRRSGRADVVPVPGGGSAFYARRFTHETAIHRADAALALGIGVRRARVRRSRRGGGVDGVGLSSVSLRGAPVDA